MPIATPPIRLPVSSFTSMTLPLGFNVIAIAPESNDALDRALSDIQKQAQVARSLLNAEQLLQSDLSHNHKFNRVRATLKFIYGKRAPQDDAQRRREALASLELNASALCALAFSPRAITQMTDNTFEALLAGIPSFVAKKGLADTIDLQIGEFIRRTVRDVAQDLSTPLLWVEGRAPKRQKKDASARNKAGEAVPIAGQASDVERSAVQHIAGNTADASHESLGAPRAPHVRSSRAMAQYVSRQTPTTVVAASSNASSPSRPSQSRYTFRHFSVPERAPSAFGTQSAPEQTNPTSLHNANYWFSRGITLSEQDLTEQLQAWLENSDIPEET